MAASSYRLLIDFDKDETYSNVLSNVSYWVKSINFSYGARGAFDEFAPSAQATIVLDNSAGVFDPEDTSAIFYGLMKRGLLLRLNGAIGITDYGFFVGRIQELRYSDMGLLDKRELTIIATDFMDDLLFKEVDVPLVASAVPGGVIRDIFSRAGLVYPYASSFFYLDQPGNALDDATLTLFDGANLVSQVQNGNTIISWAGDKPNTGVQEYFRDLVAAEMGGLFFYAARAGYWVMLDRYWAVSPTTALTVDDTMFDDVDYVTDGDVINNVTVTYYPRRFGGSTAVLWDLPDTFELAPKARRVINARYTDPDSPTGSTVGGVGMIAPQAGVDYIGRQRENGSGADYTSLLLVTAQFSGTSAELTVENTDPTRPVFVTTLRVRGVALISSRADQVHAMNAASQIKYGIINKDYTFRLIDKPELAQAFANSIVGRFGDPMPRIGVLRFNANKNPDRLLNAHAYFVSQVIRINSTRLNHDRLYMIVGERHSLRGGGDTTHDVEWVLRPVDFYNYAKLDVTSLDTNVGLAL